MVRDPSAAASSDAKDHGLHFTNDDWNRSIANGEQFTLRWNESIEGEEADLGLFRIVYPEDGLIMYELVSNLTESISAASCTWTPSDLKDDLYALWLTTTGEEGPNWTRSPPWRLTDPRNHAFHWAAPVGIPIVALLGVYGIALLICLMHRKRKKVRHEKQDHMLPTEDNNGRHPSVSSAVTVQTYDESDAPKKPSISLFPDYRPKPSLTSTPARRGSEATSECSCRVREPEKAMVDTRSELRRYSMA